MRQTNRLAALKKRLSLNSPGIAVAIFALIFAMVGGAYAANNSGGGALASASKKAKPGPTGPRGKTGPAGPAGPAGPQGPAGSPGANGDTGSQGTEGKQGPSGPTGTTGVAGESIAVTPILEGEEGCEERGGSEVRPQKQAVGTGTEICNGTKGEKGEKGEPWTPNGVLPPGATETGSWSFTSGATKEGEVQVGIRVPISFPIPLSEPLVEGSVHYSSEEDFGTFCHGVTQNPHPEAGQLCVYENQQEPVSGTSFVGVFSPASSPGLEKEAARIGALILFAPSEEPASGSGSFAVRAPLAP